MLNAKTVMLVVVHRCTRLLLSRIIFSKLSCFWSLHCRTVRACRNSPTSLAALAPTLSHPPPVWAALHDDGIVALSSRVEPPLLHHAQHLHGNATVTCSREPFACDHHYISGTRTYPHFSTTTTDPAPPAFLPPSRQPPKPSRNHSRQ